MSLMYNECPCCKTKFNKLSFMSPSHTGCEFLEGYKCFYCTKCKKRISKLESTSMFYFKNSIFGLMLIFFANQVRQIFHIWENTDNGLVNIPFIIIGLLIFQYIYMSNIKFYCFDDTDMEKVERDNSDMFIFNNEDIRIDEQEKSFFKNSIYISFLLVGGILIYILVK